MAALADAVKLLVTAALAQSQPPRPDPGPQESQHRMILAVDIVGFNDQRRDDEVQLALRRALYLVLTQAFEAAAIPWDECVHEDRGDGVLVTIPAPVPAAVALGPLLMHLHAGVRRHNRLSSEVAQMVLRVSWHAGEVHRDEHGLAGSAVNHVFRLLEAPAFKDMAARGTSEIAVIVSNDLYDAVVRHGPGLINPETYRPVIAVLKETRTPAWVHLPSDELLPVQPPASELASPRRKMS